MDCHRVRETMYLVSSHEGEDEVVVTLREHLVHCPECATYYDYVVRLLTLVREQCCRVEAPRRLKIRIQQDLRHGGSVIDRYWEA